MTCSTLGATNFTVQRFDHAFIGIQRIGIRAGLHPDIRPWLQRGGADPGADTYSVGSVISNKHDAPGLDMAASLGVECVVEPPIDRIGDIPDEMKPDLVCMAVSMRILPADVVDRHTATNIHPSLLPKYPGLHAVRQALDGGAKYSGWTVHFADSGVDTGRIIAQSIVRVESNDTEVTLAARILEREHRLYVAVVRWYAKGGA